MFKKICGSIILVGAVAASALGFSLDSGLKVGERVTPFHPTHISGPLKGTNNCPPCTFQNRPQVQVWVNGDDVANVEKIAKVLDAEMGSNKEFKAFVIFVTDNPEATAKKLKDVVSKTGLNNVAFAYIDKNDEALENYKINTGADIKNTVFLYKKWTVQDKYVNFKADSAGLNKLKEAVASLNK